MRCHIVMGENRRKSFYVIPWNGKDVRIFYSNWPDSFMSPLSLKYIFVFPEVFPDQDCCCRSNTANHAIPNSCHHTERATKYWKWNPLKLEVSSCHLEHREMSMFVIINFPNTTMCWHVSQACYISSIFNKYWCNNRYSAIR